MPSLSNRFVQEWPIKTTAAVNFFLLFLLGLWSITGTNAAEIVDRKIRLSGGAWADVDPASCEPTKWNDGEKDLYISSSSFEIARHSFGKTVTIHDITIKGAPGEKVGVTIPLPLVRAAVVCEGDAGRTPFSSATTSGGVFVHEVMMPEEGRIPLRIAVFSDAGPMSPVTLASLSDVKIPELSVTIYWILIGGMIAVCLYNLFFWLGAKKELYRINFVYVFSMLIFNLVVGRGSMLLLEILREQGIEALALVRLLNSLNNATGIWTAGYFLYFSTVVVNLDSEIPRLNRILRTIFYAMIWIAFLAFFYVIFTNDVQKVSPISRQIGSLAVVVTLSQLIYLSIMRKHFFARLFVVAYMPLVVCALIFVSFLEGNLVANPFTRNSLAFGSFMESLFMSFTIGFRMRLIEQQALQKSEEFTRKLGLINEELERQVRSHVGDIKAMLENIRQAVFMIDSDANGELWLSEQKSNFTLSLFHFEKPKARVPLCQVLDQLQMPEEHKSFFLLTVISSLDAERFAFEANESVYPKRARTEKGRELELLLYPISGSDGLTSRLLCAITDITDKLKTEAILAKSDRDNRIMLEILKLPLQKAHQNIKILEKFLLRDSRHVVSVSEVMSLLHTAKGIARVFFYDNLSQTIHTLEDLVLKGSIGPESALDEALRTLQDYEQVYKKRLDINTSGEQWSQFLRWKRDVRRSLHSMLKGAPFETLRAIDDAFESAVEGELVSEFMLRFQNEIQRTAVNLKKMPCRVEIVNDGVLHLEEHDLSALFGIMTHLIRNSLDHGIESAEERAKKGKSQVGLITVMVHRLERGSFRFDFKDDGRGVDVERLGLLARKNGRTIETRNDVVEALFSSGFSSKEEASIISGRGLGLDAVRSVAISRGGFARARLGSLQGNGFWEVIFEIQIGTFEEEMDNGESHTA